MRFDAATAPRWRGLSLVETARGSTNDAEGTVPFIARYDVDGKPGELHETSRFVREQQCWYYLNGDARNKASGRPEKIGHNAPCPCSSGKKMHALLRPIERNPVQ